MKKRSNKRVGAVAVFCAVCMTALLGVVALSIDGGVLLDDRRQVQSAADSAALAAANVLFINFPSDQGLDSNGLAKAKALASASANGFTNTVNATVTVSIPPATGLTRGMPGYAEVIVEYNQKRAFSRIWGSEDIPVRARAVARGKWEPFKNGILVLDPTSPGALTNNGNGIISIDQVPIIVNSSAPDAATAVGNGTVIAPDFFITGNPGTSGSGTFTGEIHPSQMPTPDPLAYIPEPNPNAMTLQANNPTHISGNRTETLQPGVYRGGITVTGQATLNMEPGIYYMQNGGFSFTGQGNLNAAGVMIFTAPNSNTDVININGLGSINLSPPTSGIYQGISLFQERSSTNTIYVAGNGASTITGTFYAQHGTLDVTGNGSNDVIGSQYISYNVKVGGNGNFQIDWNVDQVPRLRILNLAE